MKSTLADSIKQAINYTLLNVHTCIPGTVVFYDYAKQNASVQPSIKLTFADGTTLNQPVIQNVPVVFPRSGGASLTFPINVGDGVLLLFSEKSLERWLASNSAAQVEQGVNRRFDLTDAIAIPGLNSIATSTLGTQKDVVLIYNNSKIVIQQDGSIILQNGAATIGLNAAGKFNISNNSADLLNILDQTLQACSVMKVDGNPTDQAANFALLKTQLEQLI